MANAFVLRNVIVGIDGVDLSDHIKEVQVVMTAADIDVTAMGAGGKQHLAGIRDDSFTFTAYSDFAASKIHATINPKFSAAGTVEVKVTPSGSTIGTANPVFIGYCPVLTYTPVGGAVGDAAMTPLSMPANGTITVATTGTIP
jgi:hypothetical protein